METEKVSKVYGTPKFGLIVGIFAITVVVLLLLGLFFLRIDPLKMKGMQQRRTGMTILLPMQGVARL